MQKAFFNVKGDDMMSMIRVKNLTFSYPSSYDEIFKDVSFTIDSDWKLGFVGRNGRGKTTFMKLLLGKFAGGLFRISNNFIPVSIVRIGKRICLNRSWKISMPFGEKLSLFLRFTRQKGKSLIMSFCF